MLYVLIRIAAWKKITLNYPKYNGVCSYGIFSLGTQERAVEMVNEPSVFEPLKFYYISLLYKTAGLDSYKDHQKQTQFTYLAACMYWAAL